PKSPLVPFKKLTIQCNDWQKFCSFSGGAPCLPTAAQPTDLPEDARDHSFALDQLWMRIGRGIQTKCTNEMPILADIFSAS
ncbi:MAG: hypothetical protein ABSF41_17730, partial [Pseudolabrys sp.]